MRKLEKLRPTVSVFAGIFNPEGKLLVVRTRKKNNSCGDWKLPGGPIYLQHAQNATDERLVRNALSQAVKAETGLLISDKIQPMPAMYPCFFGGKDRKTESDFAFPIIIGIIEQKPNRGVTQFISVYELITLADSRAGNRLVSGRGRMFRMSTRMFVSRDCPKEDYRIQATEIIETLHL